MARLWFVLALAVVILTVYTFVECAVFDRSRIRALPRWVWLFVIFFIPVIGSLLWLAVGRVGRPSRGRVVRSYAPDDDPDFLRQLDRDKNQQARIRKLERELSDLDEPGSDKPGLDTPRSDKPRLDKPRLDEPGPAAGTAGIPPKKSEPGDGELPGRKDG